MKSHLFLFLLSATQLVAAANTVFTAPQRYANSTVPSMVAEQVEALNHYLAKHESKSGRSPRLHLFMLFDPKDGSGYSVGQIAEVELGQQPQQISRDFDHQWLKTRASGTAGTVEDDHVFVEIAVQGKILASAKNWKKENQSWSVNGDLKLRMPRGEVFWLVTAEGVFDGSSDGRIAYIAVWL